MKTLFRRTIAVLLCLVLTLSAVPIAAYAETGVVPSHEVVYDPTDPGYNEGKPHMTTAQFFDAMRHINDVLEPVLGFRIFKEKRLQIKTEGVIADFFNEWTRSSNGTLDCNQILTTFFPDLSEPAPFTTLFEIPARQLDASIRQYSAEMREADKPVSVLLLACLRAYLIGVDYITLQAYRNEENPMIYNIKVLVTYTDGTDDLFDTDFIFDASTKVMRRTQHSGVLGFNVDAHDYTVYACVHTWQRNFGFCLLYDYIANMTFLYDYDAKRVKFTYDGKDWLIEIWKGIYWIGVGAEFGVYNRPAGNTNDYSLYRCANDDELLYMGIDLYQGNRLVMTRPPQTHWWLLGFVIEERVYDAEYLTAKGTVRFPTEEMARLFEEAAVKEGIEVQRDGAYLEWAWYAEG